ncbi:MAG: InlB B-repeat-containing protein, partial [Spirochaetales bacterium]|nr:InlB B-repeat-containing protein [Spirochaetales bacterium]
MKKINFVLTALAVMMMLFVGCPNDETSSTTDTTIKQDTEQNGTIAQHTIAYCNLNDNGTAVMSVYAENEKVVLQDIPRTGYSFRGWFDGTDDTAQKVTGWEAGTHTDNVVLWAKWDPITVTVTLQNGSETVTITGTYGDYLPNVTVPTKTGSIFAGYYTEENRSGVRYIDQEGQGYRIFKSTTAMLLYAGWTEISSNDNNPVTNVISVVWKGSFDKAPSSPETGWAYYNTADKKTYIYDGTEWQIIAQDGDKGEKGDNGNDGKDGENGKDADVWSIGEDGYWYLNGNKTEYSSKGADGQNGQDGKDGTNGTNGADGTSIVWKGSLESAPSNPQTCWAYYNTVDKKSYIYDGSDWSILVQDGADGQDGQDGTDATSDSGYKVVLYANGGLGTMANMTCQFDEEYALPECGFTAPTGYKFNGWDKGSVGTTFTNL